MNPQSRPEQSRCDICRLKAQLEPQSLYDVLCRLSPPIELIEALERWRRARRLPQPVLDYLDIWRKLRTHEPVPDLDGRFKPVQGDLWGAMHTAHHAEEGARHEPASKRSRLLGLTHSQG